MTMQAATAELAERLEALFPPTTDEGDRHLAATLFLMLAEGRPVEIARLAEAVGRPEADVAAALDWWPFGPDVYRDDRNRVVGFGGLAVTDLAKTPHRLVLDGRELYAWCAGDALYLPVVLDREARVESRCPTTGERITLTVSPDGVRDLEPSGAVMSFLLPAEIERRSEEGMADVIGSFCHFIHFFASEEAAHAWIFQHPGTTQLSIEDGFELGRRLVAHVWGIEASRLHIPAK
jgi:alkylmercury lyase